MFIPDSRVFFLERFEFLDLFMLPKNAQNAKNDESCTSMHFSMTPGKVYLISKGLF